ncbi:S1C family serine protease [Planococcus sp. YIM B11945]|uniref:S1C family serine protease n=1 Tax=Planococcus sp. YIM B11945 TaxID=3435410 RepID=UPI003D7E138F
MNKRVKNKKEYAQARNRKLMTVWSLVLLIAIAFGGYFLVATPDSSAELISKHEKFAGKTYAGFDIASEDITLTKEPEAPVVGTVEDVREKVEEPVEVPEEITEEKIEDVTESAAPVEAPEKDKELMITNAKTFVYTIYTDLEQGSGFLYNTKGDILTNAHVVKDASYITLKNSAGQEFNGQVIGISEKTDVALVRVEELAGKEPMKMEMSKVDSGTKVFALGSPNNVSNTATEGEITATGKSFTDDYTYSDLYEMNALIKKGSSGGPLIDADTERILGINSIILEENPKIGYAIPIYTVADQLNKWVNDPITYEEEEVVLPDVKDAYFSKDILSDFIKGYYELLPYSLNDKGLEYYRSYLLPGSQGEQEGIKLVDEYGVEGRVFDVVETAIQNVNIAEKEATVEAEAVFTYHDPKTKKITAITHQKVYTVVIDEYGDYQIKTIENK